MSQISSVIFGALAKGFDKAFDRAGLEDGEKHTLEAQVTGKVDGIPFATSIGVDLSVGHAGVRASSVTPDTAETLAYALELVALAYGDGMALAITEDILGAFRAHGKVPADPKYVAWVQGLQANMRREKQSPVAGAVTVRTTQAPVLSVAG